MARQQPFPYPQHADAREAQTKHPSYQIMAVHKRDVPKEGFDATTELSTVLSNLNAQERREFHESLRAIALLKRAQFGHKTAVFNKEMAAKLNTTLSTLNTQERRDFHESLRVIAHRKTAQFKHKTTILYREMETITADSGWMRRSWYGTLIIVATFMALFLASDWLGRRRKMYWSCR